MEFPETFGEIRKTIEANPVCDITHVANLLLQKIGGALKPHSPNEVVGRIAGD